MSKAAHKVEPETPSLRSSHPVPSQPHLNGIEEMEHNSRVHIFITIPTSKGEGPNPQTPRASVRTENTSIPLHLYGLSMPSFFFPTSENTKEAKNRKNRNGKKIISYVAANKVVVCYYYCGVKILWAQR